MRRLRALARDPQARAAEERCIVEGPRVISAALDRGAEVVEAWFGHGARRAFPDLDARFAALGVAPQELKEGVLEKIGTTRTPQPVLAVARWAPVALAAVPVDGFTVVAVEVGDPGNLGTIVRSAEAAGADAVLVAGGSVDVRNPKVVRASAGAVFGIPIAEDADPLAAIAVLEDRGLHAFAAVARDGAAPDSVDLAHHAAIVVGNEARGLGDDVLAGVTGRVTVPMAGAAESLNVAMAATVLCFEAARQRAAAGPS